MKKHIWFRELGTLYCLAKYSRYGTDMRIRAVSISGKRWDVMGNLSDVDEEFDRDTSATLDLAYPATAATADAWAREIGDVR